MSSSNGNGNGTRSAVCLSPGESASGVVLQHLAFRAAFLALAYPGRHFYLPRTPTSELAGTWSPAESATAVLLRAIWEPDAAVCALGGAPFLPTTVNMSGPEQAEIVVVAGTRSGGGIVRAFRGTEEAPERGATVLYVLSEPGSGTSVRLSGPGINGSIETALPLPPVELLDRNSAYSEWPLGVDLMIVDESARVLALPRTTRVEVLD